MYSNIYKTMTSWCAWINLDPSCSSPKRSISSRKSKRAIGTYDATSKNASTSTIRFPHRNAMRTIQKECISFSLPLYTLIKHCNGAGFVARELVRGKDLLLVGSNESSLPAALRDDEDALSNGCKGCWVLNARRCRSALCSILSASILSCRTSCVSWTMIWEAFMIEYS